jgi:hypothetical protein
MGIDEIDSVQQDREFSLSITILTLAIHVGVNSPIRGAKTTRSGTEWAAKLQYNCDFALMEIFCDDAKNNFNAISFLDCEFGLWASKHPSFEQ